MSRVSDIAVFPSHETNLKSARSAFTLVEMALVFAVIGLVIGAVWTAKVSLSERNKINQADQLVLSLITNIRSYMDATASKGFFPSDPACGATSTATDITQTAITAGVFADQTDLLTGNALHPVRTPWGSGGAADTFTVTAQSTNNCPLGIMRTFTFNFSSAIPAGSCAQIILNHLTEFLDLGLYGINLGATAITGISNQNYLTVGGGITASKMTNLCAALGTPLSLGLEFRYPFSP
jgi:type II secretory pathway pseudopilin PulG